MPARVDGAEATLPFKNSAETFNESDLTLTGDGNQTVKSESVGIGTTDSVSYNLASVTSNTLEGGVVINPNQSIPGVTITAAADSTGQETAGNGAAIEDLSDNTIVAETTTAIAPGETVTLAASLSSGQDYAVYLRGSDQYTAMATNDTDNSVSTTSTEFDVVDGWYRQARHDQGEAWALSTIGVPGSSAIAYPEWSYPADVFDWYVTKFQISPDGETVKVHVQEFTETDGWTTIAGPIKRGDSIPADSENNVRYKVELSRSDVSNNPTLDSILRSFTR